MVTLPPLVAERLSAEPNQSATVTTALKQYWEYRETMKALAKLTERIATQLDRIEAAETSTGTVVAEKSPSSDLYKWDPTRGQWWDVENETYISQKPSAH